MITYDFTKDNLYLSERWLLFKLRFKGSAPRDYFGEHFTDLWEADFIAENLSAEKDPFGAYIPDGTYSLADKYYRYCVYRRIMLLRSSLWSALVSGAVSIAVTLLTIRLA